MSDIPRQYNGGQPSRLDRIEAFLERVAEQQNNLIDRQATTQQQLDDYINTAQTVLARNAVMDDVLLELRDSHEELKQNFLENQRTTNAALNQLGAILVQLTRIDPQN
ncbi:hypothetical protein [Nostoc sp. FACHB-133]|uniref:hypothetical protein n=1 Tax=Nostoc sp. FACHB-133 TaxID=2692835 RepID=UPI0016869F35|nr:hypothetical protein [Nostoc sp. FACHB-133]MBD2525671.1 hypothetical protein [Nostoc sp. FACHB-133]